MRTIQLWNLFFKKQLPMISLFAIFVTCFALTLSLYGLPIQAILYPCILCCCVLCIYLICASYLFFQKYHRLKQFFTQQLIANNFTPTTESLEDFLYQEQLSTLLTAQKRKNHEVTQANYAMTQYYTTWVHQIKTPISALKLLLQKYDTPHARGCNQEVLRIEQYVEMVLAYLRLNTASTDYLLKSYDIDVIIRHALRRFSSIFIEKKIRLSYQPTSLFVITDEKWLLFVIEQLLSNALKYTPNSGAITISFPSQSLLSIADTGIGISADELPRVFEYGYTGTMGRIDQTASGIGLYLCHTICERLNHTIQITSIQGQGTTVSLDLQQYLMTPE